MDGPVVVGVDGSPESLEALAEAAHLASISARELVVVHVRHVSAAVAAATVAEGYAQTMERDALDAEQARTRQRSGEILGDFPINWRFDVTDGDPATALIAAARDDRASAIVVGGHSHGVVGGLLLGSVAQKLVRHSPVSVIVVRDGTRQRVDGATSAIV